MQIFLPNNQNGMIMVLAMFMLALLSMIGVASMMTSTTDIEIATGERQYVETFYRTQAVHTMAGELLCIGGGRGFETKSGEDADTINTDGKAALIKEINDFEKYLYAFRIIDPNCFSVKEPPDSLVKFDHRGVQIFYWDVNQQDVDELPCPQEYTALECAKIDGNIGEEDIDLWTDIRLIRINGEAETTLADIDIDNLGSAPPPGGGAEFSSSDLGIGSTVAEIKYNIDVRSRLTGGSMYKSPSRQALGFRVMKK